jgi:hypothetical protein
MVVGEEVGGLLLQNVSDVTRIGLTTKMERFV